jgi:hypothetical protein
VGRHMWWPSRLTRKHDVDLDQLDAQDPALAR